MNSAFRYPIGRFTKSCTNLGCFAASVNMRTRVGAGGACGLVCIHGLKRCQEDSCVSKFLRYTRTRVYPRYRGLLSIEDSCVSKVSRAVQTFGALNGRPAPAPKSPPSLRSARRSAAGSAGACRCPRRRDAEGHAASTSSSRASLLSGGTAKARGPVLSGGTSSRGRVYYPAALVSRVIRQQELRGALTPAQIGPLCLSSAVGRQSPRLLR